LSIRSLISKYAPHLQVIAVDTRVEAAAETGLPDLTLVNDELGRFGLRADLSHCSRIVVRDTLPMMTLLRANSAPSAVLPPRHSAYLAACAVVSDPGAEAAWRNERRAAGLVFDRLEDRCPAIFRPSRPATLNASDRMMQTWTRHYPATGLEVHVGSGGRVFVSDFVRGGPPQDLGSERQWLNAPPRLECKWRDRRYDVRALPAGAP